MYIKRCREKNQCWDQNPLYRHQRLKSIRGNWFEFFGLNFEIFYNNPLKLFFCQKSWDNGKFSDGFLRSKKIWIMTMWTNWYLCSCVMFQNRVVEKTFDHFLYQMFLNQRTTVIVRYFVDPFVSCYRAEIKSPSILSQFD